MKNPLLPQYYYHIYNHSNGDENLFKCEDNYSFFLQQYNRFISPVAHTLAFCLMPNHFHLLVQIKSNEEILTNFPKVLNFGKVESEKHISKQFSNLFSSYTQAYNKKYSRKGSLFQKNFRRKQILSVKYLIHAINYIHQNPIKHGFSTSADDWLFSSYNSILSNKPTKLNREDIINLFNGKENFIRFNENNSSEKYGLEMNLYY